MTDPFARIDYISPLGNHCRLTRCNTCRMGVSFALIGEYDEAIAAWKRRHPCNAAPKPDSLDTFDQTFGECPAFGTEEAQEYFATEPCGPPELYWHCDCGINEPAQAAYEHGDSEPCAHCEDGVARVVTLQEAAAWNQAIALGRSWRPWHTTEPCGPPEGE